MASPTTAILDSFTRANEDPVTGWTNLAGKGNMKVVSNALTGSSATWCGVYWPAVFTAPCEWYVTVTANLTGGAIFEIAYMLSDSGAVSPIRSGNANGYRLLSNWPSADRVALQRIDNGALTSLADWAWTPTNGDTFLFQVSAAGLHTVSGKAAAGAWTQIGQYADTTYTSGTFSPGTDGTGTQTFDDAGGGVSAQVILPDADVATTGWATAPLYSKVNDTSDATVISATAA